MRQDRLSRILMVLYLGLFFAFIFLPLFIMIAAAFNASKFPTVTPWTGTTLEWFVKLWADERMWEGLYNSILVGIAVVVITVPMGTLAALFLDSLQGRWRTTLYGVMVAPLLVPGIVVGISTLVFWNSLSIPAGLHLSTIGQCSFIISYVMLLVLARLQRLDRSLEEAALDLGASHGQVLRRITLPFLRPALMTAAVLAFFQSFENFNTTLFTRGSASTLTIYIASRVRTGLTPSVNALALILIVLTMLTAVTTYVVLRRRGRRITGTIQETAA